MIGRPKYNDLSWSTGQGGIGYGDNDISVISWYLLHIKNFTVQEINDLPSDFT